MSVSRRVGREPIAEINVVPYIDVMLVLLVIFMITAPLINPGEIELPQVGKSLNPPVAPLEITVKANGALLLADRSTNAKEARVTREELLEAVKRKQAANADQPVVIAADKNVRYEEVIKVLDMLQQQQVKRIGLMAKPAQG